MKPLSFFFIVSLSFLSFTAESKVKTVIRFVDEVLSLARKSKVDPKGLTKALDSVPLSSRSHFLKCAREIPDFIDVICRNPSYIKIVNKYPAHCAKGLTRTLKAVPGKPTVDMLDNVHSIKGKDRMVMDLLPSLNPNEIRQINNAIGGKTYSSDSIQEIFNKSKDLHIPEVYRGNLFELVGSKVLASGRKVENLSLKKGSTLMDGQFNSIHGIDKIGISPDGKPILIEMSLNKDFGRNLRLDGVQMSPQWCAANWQKFVSKHPDKVDELIANGMNPKYKNIFKETDFINDDLFVRKVCLPKDGGVQGLLYTGLNGTKGRLTDSDIVRI